jgi:hypothetical protein
MDIFDYPRTCITCQGYKTMSFSWNSTSQPKMCTCPKPTDPSGSLAWECPRCKKINAPWKGSCDCTPSPLSSAPTCNIQSHNSIFPNYGLPKPPNI